MSKTIPATLPKGYIPARCADEVRMPGLWGRYRQCERKPWRDGWCKQHHPDTEAARADKSRQRWEAKMDASPYAQLAKAIDRIKELEAEVAILRAKLDGEGER